MTPDPSPPTLAAPITKETRVTVGAVGAMFALVIAAGGFLYDAFSGIETRMDSFADSQKEQTFELREIRKDLGVLADRADGSVSNAALRSWIALLRAKNQDKIEVPVFESD